jgi:hypothetical protein
MSILNTAPQVQVPPTSVLFASLKIVPSAFVNTYWKLAHSFSNSEIVTTTTIATLPACYGNMFPYSARNVELQKLTNTVQDIKHAHAGKKNIYLNLINK